MRTDTYTGGQFSAIRVIVGAALLCALGQQTFAAASPGAAVLAAVGAVAAIALALGWHRAAAAVLWVVVTALGVVHVRTGAFADPSAAVLMAIAALSLLVLVGVPRAPFGAWPARGRVDPAGGWRMPGALFAAQWVIVSAFYLTWAILLLPTLGWRAAEEGMTLSLPGLGLDLPREVSVLGNWVLLGAWLAFAPLALTRTTRPIGWCAVLAANVIVLPLAGHGELALALVVLHLLTFDPSWLPPRRDDGEDTVFYDGHCGLCQRSVRCMLAEDATGELFVFSPLGSAHFTQTIPAAQRAALPDSIVLRGADGTLLVKSNAVLRALDRLGGLWRVAALVGRLIPRPMRDVCYDGIARIRLKLFPQPTEACPVLPGHLRDRFRM